jgi:toxin ParE1/3/4
MINGNFTLRYLPKFEDDLSGIVDYITLKLHNPDSAVKLVDKIEQAIRGRCNCPLSFAPFRSVKKRKYPYYRIYVNNFTVYYVVIEDVMEVRRILYNKRDASQIIF